jgi:hypothetical protein
MELFFGQYFSAFFIKKVEKKLDFFSSVNFTSFASFSFG